MTEPALTETIEPGLAEAIVAQTPDAIVFADREGVIRLWNRGAEVLFGFAASEVVGASLDIIIPERLRAAHWSGFRRAVAAGQVRHGARVRTGARRIGSGDRLGRRGQGLQRSLPGREGDARAPGRAGADREVSRALQERGERALHPMVERKRSCRMQAPAGPASPAHSRSAQDSPGG
jgi:PAS domain-containing protein